MIFSHVCNISLTWSSLLAAILIKNSPSFKLLEDGSDVLSKEETAQLASRQEKYIVSLKNALVRIENKTYGICRETGKLIQKERLRAVPHATLSMEAKLKQG